MWEFVFCYKAQGGSTRQCGDDDFDLVLVQVQMSHCTVKKRKLVNSIIYCKNCNLLSQVLEIGF